MLELIENYLDHECGEDINYNIPERKKEKPKYKKPEYDSDYGVIAEEVCNKDPNINFGTDFTFKRKIVWFNTIGFILLHIAAVHGLYLIFAHGKKNTILWGLLVGWFAAEGVTIGAHRLWTHKSFKSSTFFKVILMIFQTMAGQNCIWIWARDHRVHHKYADTDADPHNANRGFFFSHMGWLMSKKHPLVKKMGKNVNMDDLNADKIVMFQKKYYYILYILFAMYLPSAIPVYLWNENWEISFFFVFFTRYVLLLHGTWTVNSIAHIYGNRPYDKNILATESSFVSFISSGEGWHNYHHVFPWDYKAAEFGKSLQLSSHIMDFLARIGVIYDLKQASNEMIVARSKRTGDQKNMQSLVHEKIR